MRHTHLPSSAAHLAPLCAVAFWLAPAIPGSIVLGCGRASDDPCSGKGATDECFSDLALSRFDAGDREGGLEAVRRIEDPLMRDLAVSVGARGAHLDLCAEIQDPILWRACDVNAGRHHLRLPEAGSGEADAGPAGSGTDDAIPAECRGVPAPLRDPCVYRAALERENADFARRYCAEISDPEMVAECTMGVAEKRAQAGAVGEASAICEGIAAGRWRDDCFFRLAESESATLDERLSFCLLSGAYQGFCAGHLVMAAARREVLALDGTPFDGAVGLLESRASSLIPEPTGDGEMSGEAFAGSLRTAAIEREYWVQAFHDLLLLAAAREDLGRWRELGERFAGDTARRQLFRDMLVMAWARNQALALLDAEPEPGRSLGWWAERCAEDLGSAAGQPRTGDEPLALAVASDALLRFPPGKIPAALDPEIGCALPAPERQAIALAWGLAPARWSSLRGLMGDLLEHPALAVRASALEIAAEMIDHYHQGEPLPADVDDALVRMSEDDPSPELRAKAARVRGLAAGEVSPELWSMPAEKLCP